MNNAIIIQQVYPGEGYEPMIEMNRARNAAYCEKWNMDYQAVIDNPTPHMDTKKGAWAKIQLVYEALLKGYAYIIWLDADTIIGDLGTDLRNGCIDGHIGACWMRIPQLHHWNVGVLYFTNTPEILDFVTNWLSAYPGDADGWNEQGVFNRLAMSSRIVQTISDRWNATFNYTECPDAVVLGYHGAGDTAQRTALMKSVLAELEK